MVVAYEILKGVKPLNESKSRIEKDFLTEIKMLEEDDDLNEEKELIKKHFSRIEEINEKIKEICIKIPLNSEEFGFDQQKYESIKFRQGITKRLSVLSQTLSTIENVPSSNSRRNLSKEQTLLMLPKLKCVNFSEVKPSKFEFKNFLAKFPNCVTHLEMK